MICRHYEPRMGKPRPIQGSHEKSDCCGTGTRIRTGGDYLSRPFLRQIGAETRQFVKCHGVTPQTSRWHQKYAGLTRTKASAELQNRFVLWPLNLREKRNLEFETVSRSLKTL
jgi:hypothetical protein